MSTDGLRARFLDTGHGRIFLLAHVPRVASRPAILVAPPFAEEMNKTRRMVTELALRLRRNGRPTVVVDLFGTGDSEGEFSDGRWSRWVNDLVAAANWAGEEGIPVGALLGVRLGCLLALAAAATMTARPKHLLFWQPSTSGRRFLDQHLRLGVAASLAKGRAGASVAAFRRMLADGESVEIAGYRITPELAAELDRASLDDTRLPAITRLDWMEVASGATERIPDPSRVAAAAIEAAGVRVLTSVTRGMPFWASTETVLVPELLDRTESSLAEPVE